MGLFDKLKSTFTGQVNKFSGQKDFLEAVCAGAALVASADGSVSDDEIANTTKSVVANPSLAGAFSTREIETTIETMMRRAAGGRVGRQGLTREIEEIAGDADKAQTVFLTVLDVAEGDGTVDPAEQKVIDNIASLLRIDASKFA